MRSQQIVPAGTWDETDERGAVAIDSDQRHRRRVVLETDGGDELLVDLPVTTRLQHGDGLLLDEGGVIRVIAAPEELLEIHAHSPAELVRIAWHLGNRHLPVQLLGDRIRIRADHVIADMVTQLGGHAEPIEAAFDPESGAYSGGGHGHGHDHEAER